jgi:hypothetical protein
MPFTAWAWAAAAAHYIPSKLRQRCWQRNPSGWRIPDAVWIVLHAKWVCPAAPETTSCGPSGPVANRRTCITPHVGQHHAATSMQSFCYRRCQLSPVGPNRVCNCCPWSCCCFCWFCALQLCQQRYVPPSLLTQRTVCSTVQAPAQVAQSALQPATAASQQAAVVPHALHVEPPAAGVLSTGAVCQVGL